MEQLKPGDACQECLAQGKDHKLRFFHLNLEGEQLLKCESRHCLWPHNDLVSSDEELDFEATAQPLLSLLEELSAVYEEPEDP